MKFDPVAVGRDLARRSRRAQGLPEHVEDDAVAARLAALLRAGSNRPVDVEGWASDRVAS